MRFGKGRISELAYSPDGTRLAVAGSIGIWLYDTSTHQAVALLTGLTRSVRSVAFSLDGRTLAAVANGDGTLASITFEVVEVKASTVTLSQVALVNPDGELSTPQIENGEITEPATCGLLHRSIKGCVLERPQRKR